MSIKNKNKDHLKEHAGVKLVLPQEAPTSDDPLVFWTGHPTENTQVNLHPFADGETETPHPQGGGNWMGAFKGRPALIAELAPAVQARLTLATKQTCSSYLKALRKFWRTCDQLEATRTPDGQSVAQLTSVRDLTPLHEAAMHRDKFDRIGFGIIRNLSNDVRKLLKMRPLMWKTPRGQEPIRQLIPDAHAKELKIAIKRDWERVRKTWERHDAIQSGQEPDTLAEYQKQDPILVQEYAAENQNLRKNWDHFARIQAATGKVHPATKDLFEGETRTFLRHRNLYVSQMRAIAFPTADDAHIAFHAALMRSGWNPSTLITGLDATLPNSLFVHPKDAKQSVLAVQEETAPDDADDLEELNMQGSKRRAGGRMQFCMGLRKDPDCPPNIVAAYLKRTESLRAQLNLDVQEAQAAYQRLKDQDAPKDQINKQFKYLQTLQQGTRNVWLYVDRRGAINWLDGTQWKTFYSPLATTARGLVSYLELLTHKLNTQRESRGETPIAVVTASDFRDIYARWVYIQSGGNILAVMIALGHARLQTTGGYVDNTIFSAENDAAVRKFMTALFDELAIGRLDLAILAQLTRDGELTEDMLARLAEYRSLTRSRIKVACADIRHPPASVDPDHTEGKWCGTHRCLKACPQARFLPESLDGIAMRVEELMVLSDYMSIDAWGKGGFDRELDAGEYVLDELFKPEDVEPARAHWRERILAGQHVVPGVGLIRQEAA